MAPGGPADTWTAKTRPSSSSDLAAPGVLVYLASELRREGRWRQALGVLDLVVEQAPPRELELAAYACAVAVHCDRGDYETARLVGAEARSRAVDPRLIRGLGRLHTMLFRETGDEALRAEAHTCFALADAWDQLV